MKFGNDFFVGFSPERLQAGKKNTEITDNVKLVSGANEASSNMVFDLYNSVIPKNKLHRCDSMEIAEMAKLMSNQLLIKPNKKALAFNKSFFV